MAILYQTIREISFKPPYLPDEDTNVSKTFWSLPHPSLHQTFLSPCGRQNEKRIIEAVKILNKNSSLVFPPISFKLARPTTRPKQCVIRWFSCLSLRANLGCEILITVNGHYKFKIRVYGVPVYTRCQ